ncbi:general secretion pathway protein K [Luteibacter rhizovicinus]|uniref:General secretion pathway protein K n=1 Tax=Luteibacter rhizovicinus TaxID=242606 RepID=A0A4R3YGI3_9GAMM|nr:type II secretion system protein GspK [Luteibacter rhizovicinus]TCV91052.1 general secretion pathway protein K [Luteibacter rhizovicinus]
MNTVRERGVALLVVLWACTLLAILVGGYASLSRIEGEQTRYQTAQLRARYAAEAGVMRAIHDVYARRQEWPEGTETVETPGRWIGDGRPFEFALDRAKVTVTVNDEAGKVDLNSADESVLRALFIAAGVTQDRATAIAARVVEWRTTSAVDDAVARRRYADAGLTYGPRRAQFPSLDELQAVLGMDAAVYARVEPAITLWSQRTSPEAEFAPVLALASLPGMDMAKATQYAATRDATPPGSPLPPFPGGVAVGGTNGANAVTIVSEGRDEGGIRATVLVTVRFDQINAVRDPRMSLYTILRWHNGARS